jgi:hypothetical protein
MQLLQLQAIRVASSTNNQLENQPKLVKEEEKQNQKTANNTITNSAVTNNDDKAWIENFAFYNKSKTKKWKEKMAYEFYVTPASAIAHYPAT